jgi:hypothetical protein
LGALERKKAKGSQRTQRGTENTEKEARVGDQAGLGDLDAMLLCAPLWPFMFSVIPSLFSSYIPAKSAVER